MSSSLKDQLIKAGLVSKSQVHKSRQQRSQQNQQAKTQESAQRDAELAALAAHKRERDRELNAQREQQRKAKEQAERVRQLLAAHALPRQKPPADVPAFHFALGNKAHHIYVTIEERRKLASGERGIVWFDGHYHLVPGALILQLEPLIARRVWRAADDTTNGGSEVDDPYADYQVPDDLMW